MKTFPLACVDEFFESDYRSKREREVTELNLFMKARRMHEGSVDVGLPTLNRKKNIFENW